jgi:diguanylate cyclase (GGDEF)-like protein
MNNLTEKLRGLVEVYAGRITDMSLKLRLITLTLAISIPLIFAMTYIITYLAGAQMTRDADEKLRMSNHTLAATAQMWLDFHIRMLSEAACHPDIVSMDPKRQKPHLERMAHVYKHIYLISTTDMRGRNVARNDGNPPIDYHDRQWFTEATKGRTAFQSLISRTTNQPALAVSTPIRDAQGNVHGICMFAAYLAELSRDVQTMQIGTSGYAYIVDAQNRIIAHPNTTYTSTLRDFSGEPPITALRQGHEGIGEYTDKRGVIWGTCVKALDNGWGVIVQQKREESLEPLRSFQFIAKAIHVCGSIVIFVLSWIMIGRALKPVYDLTETATAIAAGDLNRRASVIREDEIGLLAKAFNNMTEKLRGVITHLHGQTSDLENINILLQNEITERKRVEAQLRNQAEIDPLTAIYNRRKLFDFLRSEIKTAKRYNRPFSLIIFDLDHFKAVNDRFGHDIGDEVLKSIARNVGTIIRATDLFARYGGEEFVVASPETDLNGAALLAERIRLAIEQQAHPQSGRTTISVGVTEMSQDDTENSLIKRADDALYVAKSNGRNRVELQTC